MIHRSAKAYTSFYAGTQIQNTHADVERAPSRQPAAASTSSSGPNVPASDGAGLSRQHRRGRWHRTPAAHHAPRRAAAAHTFRRGYAPLGCAGAAPPNICTTAPDCPRSHACWREVIALASMQTTASASRTVPTGPCGTHAEHGGTRAPAAAAREPARRRHSTAAPVRELLRRRA